MVTIREEQKDIENAINRILDIYIQRDYSQGMNIETTIFETLIRNYCTVESVKNFYNEKIINERNPVIHARINYILICYEEELYLERQAVQYEESMREYSL